MTFTETDVLTVWALLQKKREVKENIKKLHNVTMAELSWKEEGSLPYNVTIKVDHITLMSLEMIYRKQLEEIDKQLYIKGLRDERH